MGALKKIVRSGEEVPWTHAPAYRDFLRDVLVCYPVGVHLVVRWVSNGWRWIRLVGWDKARQPVEPQDDSPNFVEFSPAYVRFREDPYGSMMLIEVGVDYRDLEQVEKFPKMYQVGKLAFYWEDDDARV